MVAELFVSVIPLLHLHILSCVRLFESVRSSLTHVVITCALDFSRRLWPWDCALARFTSWFIAETLPLPSLCCQSTLLLDVLYRSGVELDTNYVSHCLNMQRDRLGQPIQLRGCFQMRQSHLPEPHSLTCAGLALGLEALNNHLNFR